jgi:single-strand DNA-binding protein
MAGSLNKVILIGHLGADPEVRRFQDGGALVNLRLATSEKWRDKSTGERKERTEWHRVTVKNEGLVGVCEQYCFKGQLLYVEGKLQTRKWTDQAGIEKYSTEVVLTGYDGRLVMLSFKPTEGRDEHHDQTERPARNAHADAHGRAQPAPGPGHTYSNDMNDDIPF